MKISNNSYTSYIYFKISASSCKLSISTKIRVPSIIHGRKTNAEQKESKGTYDESEGNVEQWRQSDIEAGEVKTNCQYIIAPRGLGATIVALLFPNKEIPSLLRATCWESGLPSNQELEQATVLACYCHIIRLAVWSCHVAGVETGLVLLGLAGIVLTFV